MSGDVMPGGKVRVRVSAPVKLGPVWLRPGDEAEVTEGERAALEAVGAVEEATPVTVSTERQPMTQAELEAVVAETAKVLAEAIANAAITEVVTPLEARLTTAEAQRDEALARVAALEAHISATPAVTGTAGAGEVQQTPPGGNPAPADRDTPPQLTAAKTTRKGAAATKG